MKRRTILKALALTPLAGCGYLRIDPDHVLIRSDVITSLDDEARILSKAKLEWSDDGQIRVLYVSGTPYERGYQHGKLLRAEVTDNLGYLYDQALSKFHFPELFAECFERMRPFIPQEYMEEMQGLAHGSRLPLHVIHHIHALPEIGEWGGKKNIKKVLDQMMDGSLGTSCSNFCTNHSASANQRMLTVRILDWGLHKISKLHQYPLILIAKPDNAIAYANIGWIGFLGAISGMNAAGITLGEMGYRDPPGETLHGKPMPFLLRDILSQAKNLKDVRNLISTSAPTNSFIYLMSDGKTGESEMYARDPSRFLVFKPGQAMVDTVQDKDVEIPAIDDTLYGGHYIPKMHEMLASYHGQITLEILIEKVIPAVAMPSNFQNVIYAPKELAFWVANAPNKESRAADSLYSYFDFRKALEKLP